LIESIVWQSTRRYDRYQISVLPECTNLNRRDTLKLIGQVAVAGSSAVGRVRAAPRGQAMDATRCTGHRPRATGRVTLFLSGDVMTGRGIDRILPFAGSPLLHEEYVKSADRYVALAEMLYGDIPRPVTNSYIWGEALEEFQRVAPDVRIINLETSITRSEDYWRGKRVHYRMHPDNIACLSAAGIDCCVLANNHVLDWGYSGLDETLATLSAAGIRTAGAGSNAHEARAPALLDVDGHGRIVVYSFGSTTSGIPHQWAATPNTPGVNLLDDLSHRTVLDVAASVSEVKRSGDIVVASIHWGGNWGYAIPEQQQRFAHIHLRLWRLPDRLRGDRRLRAVQG
jgi:poly-gamma-glutamate synthesis protein (capsule biosynthesis protein)